MSDDLAALERAVREAPDDADARARLVRAQERAGIAPPPGVWRGRDPFAAPAGMWLELAPRYFDRRARAWAIERMLAPIDRAAPPSWEPPPDRIERCVRWRCECGWVGWVWGAPSYPCPGWHEPTGEGAMRSPDP